jgi:hypothetical protein
MRIVEESSIFISKTSPFRTTSRASGVIFHDGPTPFESFERAISVIRPSQEGAPEPPPAGDRLDDLLPIML